MSPERPLNIRFDHPPEVNLLGTCFGRGLQDINRRNFRGSLKDVAVGCLLDVPKFHFAFFLNSMELSEAYLEPHQMRHRRYLTQS